MFQRVSKLSLLLPVFLVDFLAQAVPADKLCIACHPKEAQAYARSAMARALTRPTSVGSGSFEHPYSKTQFTIYGAPPDQLQRLARDGEVAEQRVAYVIGSGSHAFGYLVRIGDHLFQSPVCYYTQSKSWGIAPGYEMDPHPDFSRPVPVACLLCHSGKPEAVDGTFNRYQNTAFSAEGISCERCHGPSDAHLRKPVPGSIVNPAKLTGLSRDSVCEQCHLAGEVRIPNPGRKLADFVPGERLEDTFTTYVRAQPPSGQIKVVSHVEQLALSACARKSDGRLWCGTCHSPHRTITNSAEYFRERCLTCHAATLDKEHTAQGRDCTGCHMQRQVTSDGGHTIFTNHRIARHPEVPSQDDKLFVLKPWREPAPEFRERNLGLALADVATQKKSAAQMVEAFQLLQRSEKNFPNDPEVLTAQASLLFIAQETHEAEMLYRHTLALKPDFAPYQVNLAAALLKQGKNLEAKQCLEKALELDPLLESGVQILSGLYMELGEKEKADTLRVRYRRAMGYKD
jgi:Tetratricopeptide repeat/Cytochrome c554 and c-prime